MQHFLCGRWDFVLIHSPNIKYNMYRRLNNIYRGLVREVSVKFGLIWSPFLHVWQSSAKHKFFLHHIFKDFFFKFKSFNTYIFFCLCTIRWGCFSFLMEKIFGNEGLSWRRITTLQCLHRSSKCNKVKWSSKCNKVKWSSKCNKVKWSSKCKRSNGQVSAIRSNGQVIAIRSNGWLPIIYIVLSLLMTPP